MKCIAILAVLVILCSSQINGNPDAKTKLSVYYETLCPDSKRFISRQLTPLLQSPLGKYVDVELVPYGKASTNTDEDGKYVFRCQHGEYECQGNKRHACVLKYLSKKDAEKVIGCSMGNRDPPLQVEKCMKTDGHDYGQISNCSSSSEGVDLLVKQGQKTHALKPRMYFVPWIVFDGVWSEETMEKSLINLEAEVCKKIGQETCDAASEVKENRGSRRV